MHIFSLTYILQSLLLVLKVFGGSLEVGLGVSQLVFELLHLLLEGLNLLLGLPVTMGGKGEGGSEIEFEATAGDRDQSRFDRIRVVGFLFNREESIGAKGEKRKKERRY